MLSGSYTDVVQSGLLTLTANRHPVKGSGFCYTNGSYEPSHLHNSYSFYPSPLGAKHITQTSP